MKVLSLLLIFSALTLSALCLLNINKSVIEILKECSPQQSIDESIFELLRSPGVALFPRRSHKQKCFLACYYKNMDIVSRDNDFSA